MISMLEKIWRKMLVMWWSLVIPHVLRQKGVKIGKNVRFYGMPIVSLAKGSTITIEDGVVLCSDSRFTDLGVSHPVILRTLRHEASITIGSDSGLSGSAICSAARIDIGEMCLIGSNVCIFDTDFHPIQPTNRRYSNEPSTIKTKPTIIRDNVFIGVNCIIGKGVTIGENSIVGAGSTVVSEVPPNTISAGSPSKFIRSISA